MAMDRLETAGECRCGRLRISIRGKPLITMACHCTGCQKMTASAFSLSALFPSAAFAVTAGETVIGGLHGGHRHAFCAHCLTWAFTRPEGMDDFVNVRTPMLDDGASLVPFIETWTTEKLPWARVPAAHSFARFPPPAEFPALLADYAAQNP
ncbi:GFA family protein [Aureimonas sp. AU22]|uniref:GFA family protein n=1 Tax=Aureimonas sp. AU22 TaxID=1638162 RepID=UPI00078326E8|nr:GFA family protein [Aureimonas sp. AU22]